MVFYLEINLYSTITTANNSFYNKIGSNKGFKSVVAISYLVSIFYLESILI